MTAMPTGRVTVPALTEMKRAGTKIVGVVAWDYQMARIVDQVGVDVVSVGDTVGVNLWGHANPFEITMDQMLTVAQAVRRGVTRALLSCDFPFGPLQEGTAAAVRAGIRLVKEAGVDMVKLDGAGDYPEAVSEISRAGIPVFAQFGITPQRALRFGIDYSAMSGAQLPADMTHELVAEAKSLEQAGAALLDFTNSGPVAGAAVVKAVKIPVIGGFGGGPWLDGRVRAIHRLLDAPLASYADDVRRGRPVTGD
jgi:3-methyl-2-oxobutanoate hydroxymethyltransferase